MKAGKSTLLNALVGERLAATDAGECTRIVTWYRHGLGYRVTADLRPEGHADLEFKRQDGELLIDLGTHEVEDIERIEVGWPSAKLESMTLIDTPGLGSTDERASLRTTASLLDAGVDSPAEADAVVYLMRHLHHGDARFLEAFMDHSIAQASPVNAVVVLSRADEIGAARPDALDSARSIAERYATDPRVRELASGVLPVAGLLAETGATLRQEQFDWLRALVRLEPDVRDHLLTSVERFRDAGAQPAGRGDPRGLAGPARAVWGSPGGPTDRRRGCAQCDRIVGGVAGALRDPRFAAGPRRGLRRAGGPAEGEVRAGRAPGDRDDAWTGRRCGLGERHRGDRSIGGVVGRAGAASSAASRARRSSRA